MTSPHPPPAARLRPPALPAHGNLRGIIDMVAAVDCFSLMDALLKTLSAHYPEMQVAALRG